MPATVINLVLKQSITFQPEIRIISRTAFPLDGWSAWSQWRPKIDSPTIIADLKTSNGGIIIDPVKRSLKLIRTDAERDAVLALNYSRIYHEIFMISPTGRTYEFVAGQIEINRSVTRNG